MLPQADYSYGIRYTRNMSKTAVRGEYHAMFLASTYHNVELHQRLRPLNPSAARAFDALERIRLEYLGLIFEQDRFPALLDDLDSAFETRHNNYGWFARTLSPAVAAEQFARSIILKGRPFYTPSTGRFDRWLWKHRNEVFGRRFNRLIYTLTDQSAFAGTSLRVLEESGFRFSHKERGEAEEELNISMGRNPSIHENLRQAAQQEPQEDPASEENPRMEKTARWIGRLMRGFDSVAYKIQNQFSGITDFFYSGIGRRLSKLSERPPIHIPRALIYLIAPPVILLIVLDPLLVISSLAIGLFAVGMVRQLERFFSPAARRQRKLFIRRLKNHFLPPYLRPILWRAQQLMLELAPNQFNHMTDPQTRMIGSQRSMETSYACYQRQEDGWVNLRSLPTHTTPDQSAFLKAVFEICPDYKRQLKEISPAPPKTREGGHTHPVFDQPDGEVLDARRLARHIINPMQEPVYMGVRPAKKQSRYTITLALSPSLFQMRAMPEIYALCAALEKKGYDTEVLALFGEAKKPFASGYGRVQPLKSVFIKKATTPSQRSLPSFVYAHHVNMPQNQVLGESALFAMNHARTHFGEKALGLYIGDESWGTRYRTFLGRTRKIQKVLEAHDFDFQVWKSMNRLVEEKKSHFGPLVFQRSRRADPHLLAHAVVRHIKSLMDNHPACG
jgi:hypothetical protein